MHTISCEIRQAITPPRSDLLPVVTACRKRDIPTLRILVDRAASHLGASELHIITHRSNFGTFKSMPSFVRFHDQDSVIPGMTLESLRSRTDIAAMPLAAGWYFQQLLKMSLREHFPEWKRFLIWDSDTLPLRQIEFFDTEGRLIFTRADEWHGPYFRSIENLLGIIPTCRQSFITQHIPVDVDILREIQSHIDSRFKGQKHWAWKIMENLPPIDQNCFSEYETIAHYSLAVHPTRCVVRDLPWTRHGRQLVRSRPNERKLDFLSQQYAFAAFESSENPVRRVALSLYQRLPEAIRKVIRRSR